MVLRWTAPVIYTYSTIAPELEPYPWLNQLYICNPFNAAVMLNNRAFWIPYAVPDPNVDPISGATQELPAHMFERGFIILAAGFVFVGGRAADLQPLRRQIRGQALMTTAMIVEGVTKTFKLSNSTGIKSLTVNAVKRHAQRADVHRRRQRVVPARRRRLDRPDGSQRLGQEHAAEADQRRHGADLGHGAHPRAGSRG